MRIVFEKSKVFNVACSISSDIIVLVYNLGNVNGSLNIFAEHATNSVRI